MTPTFEDLRPRLRTDIRLGPALINNEKTIHYLKDLRTQQTYRVGAPEYFLMSRMTGTRELRELSAEYEATFHTRLNAQAWAQLLTLMARRALFEHQDGASQPVAQQAGKTERIEVKGTTPERATGAAQGQPQPLQRRLSLFNPEPLLSHLLPWIRFAFTPFFVYPALLILCLLEAFCILHAHEFLLQLGSGLQGYLLAPLLILFLALVGLFLFLHELAHGLVCKHFGGSVPEIGVAWTGYVPVLYCKIDDVLLFPQRRQRVLTAFAGIFVNLLMLIPFALLWYWSPLTSPAHTISAFVLLVMNVFILFNALPLFDLDGYTMFKYSVNILDLREQASRRSLLRLRNLSFRSREQSEQATIPATPRRRTYVLYTLLASFSLLVFLCYLLWCLV